MKRIPAEFELLNHRIRVKVIPKSKWEYEDWGYWDPAANQILLMRQQPDLLWHTFWHEMVHACLSKMSHPLNEDETFVDNLAGHLAQAIKSAK